MTNIRPHSYGGDTPRTDAITQMAQKCGEDSSVVDADFARQLEIERNSYALAAEKAVMKNAALSRAIGTPVAWQAKHPGDGYEWFQTTKEVFDSKGHGGYEYRELYAAVPAGMKFPERNDAPLTTGDLAWQRETQDRFARNPPNHMTSDVADTLPPSCGPNDAQTLALIEDRKLTVTWHFNGHHTQAICYDHKGNNRTSSVDLGIAVAECIKRCDATGNEQEKNDG